MPPYKARPMGRGSTSGSFLLCYNKQAMTDSLLRSAGLDKGLRGARLHRSWF